MPDAMPAAAPPDAPAAKPSGPRYTGHPRPKRHPVLFDWPPGVFCPAAVGIVPGYPKTPEGYARRLDAARANSAKARAEGTLNRLGVANGYGGRKGESLAIIRRSREAAPVLAEQLFDMEGADIRSILAIQFALEVANGPWCEATRLQASRLLMTFAAPRPDSRREVSATLAEDILAQLDAREISRM